MHEKMDTKVMVAVAAAAAAVSVVVARGAAKSKQRQKEPNEMFTRFLLAPGKATLSTGEQVTVTVPYHVYDGWASVVNGTCTLQEAKRICSLEDFVPVETNTGKALAMISFGDFTRTNAGPHTECQFTLIVSRKRKVVPDSSFATFKALALDSDPECHCLITEI